MIDGHSQPTSLRVVSLFSGVAGGDVGLERAGHSVVEMCESWDPARRVLETHFPNVHVHPDVRTFNPTAPYDLLSAGFPCVDLSHAGGQLGIFGPQSGLVEHVFRIAKASRPEWILIENVPNLLRLQHGAGIRHIVNSLENLGYAWAYRVLDSRAFGVSQRRNRVILLASLNHDPASVLLSQDAVAPQGETYGAASGFYWTEGRRGVGLVANAVPTLKGGSTLGLPSAPAIWMPKAQVGRRIVLPSIEDAEELQGFPRGWTEAADSGFRWKLVGNAVTVGLAEWVGQRLANVTATVESVEGRAWDTRAPWPNAAFGEGGTVWSHPASKYPIWSAGKPLSDVVDATSTRPLSYRATKGFLSRIEESGLPLPTEFMMDLESHMSVMRGAIDGVKASPESWASSPAGSARMKNTKQRNTRPEEKLRRALSDRKLRYQLQVRPFSDLRWRSDFVFKGAKVAVELRGCFWHVCPIHRSWPKANAERWQSKLGKNVERDARMQDEFTERNWLVVVVWEHEDSATAAARIEEIVRARRHSTPRSVE